MPVSSRGLSAFVLAFVLTLAARADGAGLGLVAQFGGDVTASVDSATAQYNVMGDPDGSTAGGLVRGGWPTVADLDLTSFSWTTSTASGTSFDIQDTGVDAETVSIGGSTSGTASLSTAIADDRLISVQWSAGTDPGDSSMFVYGSIQ
jgi:hypothetical protein